jgi:hypothetical protein
MFNFHGFQNDTLSCLILKKNSIIKSINYQLLIINNLHICQIDLADLLSIIIWIKIANIIIETFRTP